MICLRKGSRRGVQVKAFFAWKGKTASAWAFVFLDVCRTLPSAEQFSFFLMTTVVHLVLCWNCLCFRRKLPFTLINGPDCHFSAALVNFFLKLINQVRSYWMLCSMGAFTVVEMNMKPLKEKKHILNTKVDKSPCRSILLNNILFFFFYLSFISDQRKAGNTGTVGVGSALKELLMCANTLKAMGPFLGDGWSLLN